MIITKNKMLIVSIFLIANVPNVDIEFGSSLLKIYNVIFFIMLMLFIQRPEWKLHPISTMLLVIVLFFSVYLIVNGRDEHLISVANSFIPDEWQILYGKMIFDDFYRSVTISSFQLANFLILAFYFNYFYMLDRNTLDTKPISKVLFISVLIQITISLIQLVFLKNDRPSGSFGNAQSLGFFYLLCISYFLVHHISFKRAFYVALVLFGIFITGTRSALFIAMIIVFLSLFNVRVIFRKMILMLLFASMVTWWYLFSSSTLFRDAVLGVINIFTSPHSMYVRGLMWNSFFQTMVESPFLGAKGITVYFADNFFWFFILSYGVFGLGFIYYFVKSIISSSEDKFVYLIGVCIIMQSASYYGFFVENMGILLIIFLAISLKNGKKLVGIKQ